MVRRPSRRLLVLSVCVAMLACEGDSGQTKPGDDAQVALPSCETFSKCLEADFVDVISSATPYLITVNDQGYTPKCMRGYTGYVSFFGATSDHPLTIACGPTQPKPIDIGVGFHFATPGLYGYFCQAHGDATGQGHVGVIKVEAKP